MSYLDCVARVFNAGDTTSRHSLAAAAAREVLRYPAEDDVWLMSQTAQLAQALGTPPPWRGTVRPRDKRAAARQWLEALAGD